MHASEHLSSKKKERLISYLTQRIPGKRVAGSHGQCFSDRGFWKVLESLGPSFWTLGLTATLDGGSRVRRLRVTGRIFFVNVNILLKIRSFVDSDLCGDGIEARKAHGQKSSDRGYPLGRFRAGVPIPAVSKSIIACNSQAIW